jgi:cryptochrome
MWLSASAFFHQYYRVYSPVSFGKQYDPNGDYIRHFIPVLKNMPAKYIFSPWEAPLAVQHKAGCVIGQDYPLPIVDHDSARDRNLKMMKAAYGGAGQAEEGGEEEGGDGRGKVSAAKRPKQK